MRVSGRVILSIILVLATFVSAYQTPDAAALTLTNRSLTLQANGTVGGTVAGGIVHHEYKFTVKTAGNVGSIKFQYCTTAADAPLQSCTMPSGLVTTSALTGTQTGATGFTMNNTTNGSPYLTRTAASIAADTVVTLQLRNITNPTSPVTPGSNTFYVRISTYVSTDTTGTAIDSGAVAASIANQIQLTGIMPESLIFCAGANIDVIVSTTVPDCTTATPGNIAFDRLFSPNDTAIASSEMAASTNAQYGYVITVNGVTLTSGSNTITAMATRAPSTRGTGQFGLNLKANTAAVSTPAVGAEITQASNGSDYKGRPSTGYDTVNEFKFTSGDTVADSAQGGAGPTNGQIYTASYIVNVPGNQLPGTYVTTLTYICTPTF